MRFPGGGATGSVGAPAADELERRDDDKEHRQPRKVKRRAYKQGSFCVSCDEREWEELGYARTYLVHPTDDRERILWRKLSRRRKFFPTATVATPEQWKRQR